MVVESFEIIDVGLIDERRESGIVQQLLRSPEAGVPAGTTMVVEDYFTKCDILYFCKKHISEIIIILPTFE